MKIKKFVKKNRRKIVIWACVIVALYFLYRRVWGNISEPNARKSAEQLPYRTFDPTRVYKMIMLTDTWGWDARITAIANEGFDTVQLVIPMSDTINGDFSKYLAFAQSAAQKGLNIVLKTWIRISPAILPMFGESETMIGAGGLKIQNNGYTLSFASSKWGIVYDWCRKVKAAFQPLHDAGYIIAHFPACSDTQEWVYPIDFFGDSSAIETTASSGSNMAKNLSYSIYQTNQLREKLHAIADIFTGWNNGLDCGNFYYDNHRLTGSYNFEFIADHPQIKFIKNNPLNDNTVQFNAALCYDWKRRTGKYFSAEYTNSPANTSADTLAENHAAMINNSCNLISLAFHAPDGYGGGQPFQKAKDIRRKLVDWELWATPVKTPNRSGDFTYTIADLFANGHNGIINNFNSNPNRLVRIT